MGGKPCIRAMRVIVGMPAEPMAAGRTIEQLLADSPTAKSPTFAGLCRSRHVSRSGVRSGSQVD